MFYVFAKLFHEKLILFVSCVKKLQFGAQNKLFTRHLLVIFTQDTKNVGFVRNYTHGLLTYTREIFVRNFCDILKCFSRWQKHKHLRSKLHFHQLSSNIINLYKPALIVLNHKSRKYQNPEYTLI
jgi:hypothetical protein